MKDIHLVGYPSPLGSVEEIMNAVLLTNSLAAFALWTTRTALAHFWWATPPWTRPETQIPRSPPSGLASKVLGI